jgi:copper homeostasis protein (lipoprotein)
MRHASCHLPVPEPHDTVIKRNLPEVCGILLLAILLTSALHAGAGNALDIPMRRAIDRPTPVATGSVVHSLRGLYRYLADVALFTDCASGERPGVAERGDDAALQRACAQAVPSPGGEMLATVEGRVEPRPPEEERAARIPNRLAIERFIAIAPDPCPAKIEPLAAQPAARDTPAASGSVGRPQ